MRALAWNRQLLSTPKCKQWVLPQCGYLTTKLQSVSSQTIIMLIFCGMRFFDYVVCGSGNGTQAQKDEVCFKLVFLYTIILRYRGNKT
jgi:hypothetical protein